MASKRRRTPNPVTFAVNSGCWNEKATNRGAHAKPIVLQSRLIEALTNPRDTVVDPAAGSYSVLQACRQTNRRFLGCDIAG